MSLAPIAADDTFSTPQGAFVTTVSGRLGANNGFGVDRDPDGTVLGWAAPGFTPFGDGGSYLGASFTNGVLGLLLLQRNGEITFPVLSTSVLITTAQGGQVVLQTNGNFTYTAPAGFSGIDSFDYTLVDIDFGADIGRVTLNVLDTPTGNDRPDAKNDVFAGREDTPISGNVLSNNGNGADIDRNGDAMTVVSQSIGTARGGVVAISADGSFVYRPPANYSGADSFAYAVKDVHGASNSATVTLNIAAVNDAPLARDDSFSGAHGKPIAGNVLADNGGGADADPENDPLAVAAATVVTASGGTVSLLSNGDFTYSPAAKFVGLDSFAYAVSDGRGGTSTATVSLNVFNTAPVARADLFTAAFGGGIVGNVLLDNGGGADSDADGDTLGVAAANVTSAHGGRVAVGVSGVFRYTPAEAFYGVDSFTYTLKDGFGGTSIAIISIKTPAPAGSVFGSAADEAIDGTPLGNFIFALAGDDTVNGLGGNDLLAGGDGEDTLSGGVGNDKLYGQGGRDTLQGDAGNDFLSGGLDRDDLSGGSGIDKLAGGAGFDILSGGAGADQFVFDAPTGASYDRVQDFEIGDKLCVTGAQYRLAVGALADASYFATAGAASAGHGRFLYSEADRSLSWDADGNAATANRVIAIFSAAVALSHADFLVL
jgi:Bacterial Ig domain/RTX calcium-binding nonapeptide repeat (4 copies)